MTIPYVFIAFIVLLVAGGYAITSKWNDAPEKALARKTDSLNQLTSHYNEVIKALEDSFNMEDSMNWSSAISTAYTKKQYFKRYQAVHQEYKGKRKALTEQWEREHPQWCKARNTWMWIFVIGVLSGMAGCFSNMPVEEVPEATTATAMSRGEATYWNAENIPIPYLTDATQYVSNPDYVLAQTTVDSMNIILDRLNKDLEIESVVIVVNHIENDDPYRMAQDVGNKYGVGRGDRGLIIVCGYEDHSLNMSPGRELEADLTDAECHRLEQHYAVPAMKAEKPDSGMLYLVKATYALLEKKEMPQMTPLMSQDNDDDALLKVFGLYTLFFIAWLIFFARLNRKYHWIGLVGAVPLMGNPFYVEEYSDHSGGGGFFGGGGSRDGGFGGGSFGGGSFGGGSFGGGGATSRW